MQDIRAVGRMLNHVIIVYLQCKIIDDMNTSHPCADVCENVKKKTYYHETNLILEFSNLSNNAMPTKYKYTWLVDLTLRRHTLKTNWGDREFRISFC